jgi:hypothetical protein
MNNSIVAYYRSQYLPEGSWMLKTETVLAGGPQEVAPLTCKVADEVLPNAVAGGAADAEQAEAVARGQQGAVPGSAG